MYLAWKDEKQVNLLSTVFSTDSLKTAAFNKKTKRYSKVNKPKLLVSYSMNMKGVDINNMMCAFFEFVYKTTKWWKPNFMRLVHISLTNIYILHRKFCNNGKIFHYKNFIRFIVEKLLLEFIWKNFDEALDYQKLLLLTYPGKKRRKCEECKKNNNKRTDTYFYCWLLLLEFKKEYKCCEDCFSNHLEVHVV